MSPAIFVDSRKGVRDVEKPTILVHYFQAKMSLTNPPHRTINYRNMQKCFIQILLQRDS